MTTFVDRDDLEDKDINVIPVRNSETAEIVKYISRKEYEQSVINSK
jgi:hypothetical protein